MAPRSEGRGSPPARGGNHWCISASVSSLITKGRLCWGWWCPPSGRLWRETAFRQGAAWRKGPLPAGSDRYAKAMLWKIKEACDFQVFVFNVSTTICIWSQKNKCARKANQRGPERKAANAFRDSFLSHSWAFQPAVPLGGIRGPAPEKNVQTRKHASLTREHGRRKTGEKGREEQRERVNKNSRVTFYWQWDKLTQISAGGRERKGNKRARQ